MAYELQWRPSPSYTPGGQTQAYYGQPRSISIGAGHWWDDPSRGPSFEGVVASLTNPNRQVSAHAVVTAGRVAELVHDEDTAWATGPANPYTFAIETDPRITTGGDTAEAIMATLAEYIADKGYHNLPWKPHKAFMTTGCNPIDWDEVRRRAQATWSAKHNTPAPAPQPAPAANADLSWEKLPSPTVYVANKAPTHLWNFNKTDWSQFGSAVKDFYKDDQITIFGKCYNRNLNTTYLVTEYSYNNKIANGFNQADLNVFVSPQPAPAPEPVVAEWIRNLVDVEDVKLQVLVPQAPLFNLNDLTIIKQIGQGTWVDVSKKTSVNGRDYLISSYSITNSMPNGMLASNLGIPAVQPGPPVVDKPEWLKNWQDIADVDMYLRADSDLVNLTNGSAVTKIKRGERVRIASTTEWHGQKYAISQYSTERNVGNGIRLDDLDLKPIVQDTPITPAPNQPNLDPVVVEARVSALEKIVQAIVTFLKGLGFKG